MFTRLENALFAPLVLAQNRSIWRSALKLTGFFGAVAVGALSSNVNLHQSSSDSSSPAGVVYARTSDPFSRDSNCFNYQFREFVLGERFHLAEDVCIFRFLLPTSEHFFDLKPCCTLQCRNKQGTNKVEQVIRSYTPITSYGTKGYFDILVKKQRRGRMTEHLFSMRPGEKLEFRVMLHKMHYVANRWNGVGCIAGGTGICSILQIIREICENPNDQTRCSLLYANRTEAKILLRGTLEDLQRKHPEKFRLYYTIDSLDTSNALLWEGFVGNITPKMIMSTMPPPGSGSLVVVCGPDKMLWGLAGVKPATLQAMSGGRPQQPSGGVINNIAPLGGVLAELGYKSEEVYRF